MLFSVIGLGTWKMEDDEPTAVEALRRGLAAGANHIDTAEFYGDGRVERIVGKAVRGLRDRVFLVSKVTPSHASYDQTIQACERSLKNLGTDHLDAYLLHWREKEPLEGTFKAFEKLVRDGKIRAFGVSNFAVKDMEEALRLVGPGRIACNQVLYHLGERAIEHALLPWCIQRGIAVVAYSPLGQGPLASHKVLKEIAMARNAAPAQVALKFLIRQPGVFAIPKASSAAHAVENAAADALELSAEDVARLDQAFPSKKRRGLPMI